MEGIREGDARPMALSVGHALLAIEIDESIYGLDVIFKAAYRFTDRCYIFLARTSGLPQHISVTLMAKQPAVDIRPFLGEFCNELIDQQIRVALSRDLSGS
jgi:His-Xaa-Ser system protein HxsD